MAPVTRSSVHGRPPMLLQREDERVVDDVAEDAMNEDDLSPIQGQSVAHFQSSAQELLQPLQETADRVGRQVEEFAKKLDKFNSERDPWNEKLWDDAVVLINEYKEIALRLKQKSSSKHTLFKPSEKKRRGPGDDKKQAQQLQSEAYLWTLAGELLGCKAPYAVKDATKKKESRLEDLHRYSSNSEVWEAFLDSDVVAQEYECLLDWLQETAYKECPTLEDTVSDLTQNSNRGDSLWSEGLIYTKSTIKNQKRARAWPLPLDPQAPGLSSSHQRQDGKTLVSQMDPDAPSRQDAFLEKSDEYYEAAAWQVCWEMLRRGMSFEMWRNWWRDRNELWRSAVMNNCEARDDLPEDSPWVRIINLASNDLYADLCTSLAKQGVGRTDFEISVLGVLGGSYSASTKACKTIDDHLFCLINSLLIERWRRYIDAYRRKISDGGVVRFQPSASTISQVRDYLQSAQVDETTKDEMHDAHKYLEAALMGQSFDNFLFRVGNAAAETAHSSGQSAELFPEPVTLVQDECAKLSAQDQDSVRMVVHLQLVLRALGFLDDTYRQNIEQMDNNIVNYIGLLERSSKFSLLPLYASKLSADRIPPVLGLILIKVHEPKERELQVRLMKQYKIAFQDVIYALCEYARAKWDGPKGTTSVPGELTKVTESHNKIVRIKPGFMGTLTVEEAAVVTAHEWLRHMDAESWGMAAWSATALYKIFLLQGHLAAAKALAERVSLTETSLAAVNMNLSLATAMSTPGDENGDIDMEGSDMSEDVKPLSPRKRREQRDSPIHPLLKEGTSRETLAAKSLVWAQLEQLVRALEALEDWQNVAQRAEQLSRTDVRQMKLAKKELSQSMDLLQDAMQPLLDDDFLRQPNDEDEHEVLDVIRVHYLPECILGYNSALYFGGHIITRQYLVQCMTLAQLVAQNENLTSAFVEAERMKELVTAFAQDSQALLRADEAGGSSTRSKKNQRGNLGIEGQGRADIWRVEWNDDSEVNIEDVA